MNSKCLLRIISFLVSSSCFLRAQQVDNLTFNFSSNNQTGPWASKTNSSFATGTISSSGAVIAEVRGPELAVRQWPAGGLEADHYLSVFVNPLLAQSATLCELRLYSRTPGSNSRLRNLAIRSSLDGFTRNLFNAYIGEGEIPVTWWIPLDQNFDELTKDVEFRFYGYHADTPFDELVISQISIIGRPPQLDVSSVEFFSNTQPWVSDVNSTLGNSSVTVAPSLDWIYQNTELHVSQWPSSDRDSDRFIAVTFIPSPTQFISLSQMVIDAQTPGSNSRLRNLSIKSSLDGYNEDLFNRYIGDGELPVAWCIPLDSKFANLRGPVQFRVYGFHADIPQDSLVITKISLYGRAESSVPTIRCAGVEVCWPSSTNVHYQPQYRSSIGPDVWINLGVPTLGNGSTNCLFDFVGVGDVSRYYRVIPAPAE